MGRTHMGGGRGTHMGGALECMNTAQLTLDLYLHTVLLDSNA